MTMVLKTKTRAEFGDSPVFVLCFSNSAAVFFQKKIESQSIAFRFSMESQSPSSGADASPTSTLVAVNPLGKNLLGNLLKESVESLNHP